MTLYLEGFNETALGVRSRIRLLQTDVPTLGANLYFYGRYELANGVWNSIRMLGSQLGSADPNVQLYALDDNGNGVTRSVRELASSIGVVVSAYAPSAVSFTPEVTLTTNGVALGISNSSVGLVSAWIKGVVGRTGDVANGFNSQLPAGVNNFWSMYNLDMMGNLGSGVTYNSETLPGFDFAFDGQNGVSTIRGNTNDATGGTNHSALTSSNAATAVNGAWQHWIYAYDVGFSQGNKRAALYINGVKIAITGPAEQGTIGSFLVAVNSALGFGVNFNSGNGGFGAFDAAQIFFDFHTTGLIDGSGNIAAATVTKFYNNGPVDYGTDGSTPLGSVPDIYFNGDKSSFATNKGAAAAFTLSAPPSSTAPAVLFDAPVGPAGPQDTRPYLNWLVSDSLGTHTSGTTTWVAANAPRNRGCPIAIGDLLILTVHLVETSVFIDRAITLVGTGWNTLAGFPLANNGVGGYASNTSVYWRIADGTDVVASGAVWSVPPTINWTANANSIRSGSWNMQCFKGANATTPIQASGVTANGAIAAPTAPTVTPTTAATLLTTQFCIYDLTDSLLCTPPAGQNLRYKLKGISGAQCFIMTSDEKLTGTGATGTRAMAQAASHPVIGVNMVIAP